MHFTVSARLIPDTAADFLRKLTDGTVENQKPDGKGIVESMNRAKIGEDGIVRWSEVCFCRTPLEHERATVYDLHFTDIQTEEVEDHVEFEGKPFMDYLENQAKNQ